MELVSINHTLGPHPSFCLANGVKSVRFGVHFSSRQNGFPSQGTIVKCASWMARNLCLDDAAKEPLVEMAALILLIETWVQN